MVTIFFTFWLLFFPILVLVVRRRRRKMNSPGKRQVPPGSLGLPIIGQSISFMRAMRSNTIEEWLKERVRKYGAVSKLSIFGKPAVFIYGQAANKLIFGGENSNISNQQPKSTQYILGDRNLLEMTGEDHKRLRNALSSFLKPDSLKEYVGRMDVEVRKHLHRHWQGNNKVTVLPLMKALTFNIMRSLLFGIEEEDETDKLMVIFQDLIKGIWSIPLNLPFTTHNRSRQASSKVQNMIKDLISEKRKKLENGGSPRQDLISCLLSIRGENNEILVSDKEIIHNVLIVMVAGYDTSATLITFLMRALANNPHVYAAVLQENEEISKGKAPGELLTWEDLAKMKYTWRVALEVLRLVPPAFVGFRTAAKDFEYGGYIIPKGWKILWAACMTHMDDNIFPDPTKFDPTRFENPGSVPPACFIPFGGGPRMCPGYEFSRLETLTTIHHLVIRFKWKLCHTDNVFSMNPTPEPTEGLPIEITPRV